MSIFENIVKISDTEDKLRESSSNINDNLLFVVKTKQLEYTKANFGDKIVLTGSKTRETISDEVFNMEFSRKTYDLLTYLNWDNVVVAGGSIVNIITKSGAKLNDIDLFVYGLDKANARLKIDHIINAIKEKANDLKYETRVYMNNHVINIYVFDTKKVLQVQIILRLYDSMAQVMVGFDVDCCCVCWDGKNIMTTNRGLNALKYRVNLANLKRRSPSYENRLIKYSGRGFDVITNFDYKTIYNKMFFMNSNNYGFTRLLEQELINNGQLKNIIFTNTLKLRKVSSFTNNFSNYVKYNLEIKNVVDTENCITKYNANVEDVGMKFKKYTTKELEFLESNVMEQFTGSFNPITNESWIGNLIDAESKENVDEVGRSPSFINLKYNKYKSIDEFENVSISDMSNFDTKCLAVMYLSNENDIVKIVENKNIPTSTNMYRISPVQLAILLGRTNLALRLMKNHSYETMKELIYMTDNDKLYTSYCNSAGINYGNVDANLVAKYECENISNNIHNQHKEDSFVDEFHKLDEFNMYVKVGTHNGPYDVFQNLRFEQLPYEVFRLIVDKVKLNSGYNSKLSKEFLENKIIKRFEAKELELYQSIMSSPNEKRVLDFVLDQFIQNENKKSVEFSENIIKLFKLRGLYNESLEYKNMSWEMNNYRENLYTCMVNIYEPRLTLEVINKLLGPKDFDKLFSFVLFLDDVKLVEKLIPKDDLYVKLKYYYHVDSKSNTNIGNYLAQIDKDRQLAKIKINKIIKNTDDHVNALTDGELKENYVRCENVFGMTPDDNIVAKMLLIFNKVVNRKDALSDKDITTLKTMRKSIYNIKRNSEINRVESSYFYSLDLHNLFFNNESSNPELVTDENHNQFDNGSQSGTQQNQNVAVSETITSSNDTNLYETDSEEELCGSDAELDDTDAEFQKVIASKATEQFNNKNECMIVLESDSENDE